VAPDGRVRYTTSVSNYLYRYAGLMQGEQPLPANIGKYVVQGIVIDELEHAIAGAAIRVNNEIAFTDSEGRFIVRVSKPGRASLRVAFEDFLTPTIYELVSAPSQVDAALEQDAKTVVVILRRVTQREKLEQIRSELLAKQKNSESSTPDSADGGSHSSSRSTSALGGGGTLPQH
ncbi:MAG: carboxypeptidase-like regulatory domain-containing protein, partial [Acidobacteriales bacterium]|nr:carboxypeptidase-like regulatory domain-containing protein [Terriglobales bacterium]